MSRKTFDCRDLPGEGTLNISGEEAAVNEAQARHAVAAHDVHDGDQLRGWIRSLLRDETAEPASIHGAVA
jgi:hypothetical protein